MTFWKTVKIAFSALITNKLRTILTMLGIIIGVGAVVGMLGIAKGAEHNITKSIESIGTDTIFISAFAQTRGGVSGGMGSITTLKVQDALAIQRECPHVKLATPFINTRARVINGNLNWSTSLAGVSDGYQYIANYNLDEGGFFSEQELKASAKVCVIGSIVRDNLFLPDEEAIDSIIRINRIPFKVIGVLAQKGTGGGSDDQDDLIIIPYTTMEQRFYKENHINMIMASASSREDVKMAAEEITMLLRQRHRIREGDDDDFRIQTLEEIIKMVEGFARTFTILLGSIASISLLVGGIGIMNIMLVSVTERIREIGIRMALGAKPRDILSQFLIEAVVLSLSGGILGVAFGYLIALIVGQTAKWPVIITMFSIFLSLSFASAVGIFFGFFPAWKASKLDPIEALRHE